MSRLSTKELPLPGLHLVSREKMHDQRGFLSRLFCAEELRPAGWTKPIAQINQTLTSSQGTVRGLHYQNPPHAEMKLVTCLRGEIWDVALDVRANSPTFLHWHAEKLSADNGNALLIPEGFAHGFQTLTDNVELLYLHSENHESRAEAGINPSDPMLAIDWPFPIGEISQKDARRAMLATGFKGVSL